LRDYSVFADDISLLVNCYTQPLYISDAHSVTR